MGNHFALTYKLNTLPSRSRSKSGRGRNWLRLDTNALAVAVFFAIILSLVAYLVEVNTFSTKGFEIRTLQKQIETLKQSQNQLQVQAAQLQSFQRIQGDNQIINMVPVTSISYIQTTALSQR